MAKKLVVERLKVENKKLSINDRAIEGAEVSGLSITDEEKLLLTLLVDADVVLDVVDEV